MKYSISQSKNWKSDNS